MTASKLAQMHKPALKESLSNDGHMRCPWATVAGADRDYCRYHDREWGVPLHGDDALFEFLVLEGAQAGLSWRTVLAKREHYRKRFHRFSISKVAAMTDTQLESLLEDPGLIRNRLKIFSARDNARAACEVIALHGSLDSYLWSFVDHEPQINHWRRSQDVPAATTTSDTMSKSLRKLGFRFVGSTICYAFMQATGMVNDHLVQCFRHQQLQSKNPTRP